MVKEKDKRFPVVKHILYATADIEYSGLSDEDSSGTVIWRHD